MSLEAAEEDSCSNWETSLCGHITQTTSLRWSLQPKTMTQTHTNAGLNYFAIKHLVLLLLSHFPYLPSVLYILFNWWFILSACGQTLNFSGSLDAGNWIKGAVCEWISPGSDALIVFCQVSQWASTIQTVPIYRVTFIINILLEY